jgi:hypothetical protein
MPSTDPPATIVRDRTGGAGGPVFRVRERFFEFAASIGVEHGKRPARGGPLRDEIRLRRIEVRDLGFDRASGGDCAL